MDSKAVEDQFLLIIFETRKARTTATAKRMVNDYKVISLSPYHLFKHLYPTLSCSSVRLTTVVKNHSN